MAHVICRDFDLTSISMLYAFISIFLLVLLRPLFARVVRDDVSLGPATNLTDYPLECYGQRALLKPTTIEDCREIAEGIMALHPWGRPWVFSNVPSVKADKPIPLGIKSGSCRIRLMPIKEKSQVTDSWTARYFAHQIHRAINECVTPPPHLGGEGDIGPKKIIALTVSGAFTDESPLSSELTIARNSTPGNSAIFLSDQPGNLSSQS